jgi:hypothetical protein
MACFGRFSRMRSSVLVAGGMVVPVLMTMLVVMIHK